MATQNIYSMVDTWNNAGTTFTGIGLSVTDTASAAGSLLLDLQVGGASRVNINKNGAIRITDPSQNALNDLTPAALIVESTHPDNRGPRLNTYHNSASPADNDSIASINFWANNSSATAVRYSGTFGQALTVTAGAEAGAVGWYTYAAGSIATRMQLRAGLYMNGATGGDQGANTINASSYYANGNIIADTNALIRCRVYTVATLPTGIAGARAFVSDANATTFASVVAGGGANGVPVYSDGTNWRIG